MVGYNLYLVATEDGEPTEEPLFLYLAYATFKEALRAKEVLEQVYGEDTIEIEPRTTERSLVE